MQLLKDAWAGLDNNGRIALIVVVGVIVLAALWMGMGGAVLSFLGG